MVVELNETVVIAVIFIGFVFLVGFWRVLSSAGKGRHFLEIELHTTKTELNSLQGRYEQLDEQFDAQENELSSYRNNYHNLQVNYAELNTTHKERERAHQKQLLLFEDQKKSLEKEFENLANKIFDEKGKLFSRNSQLSLETLLQPFREQITEFRSRVDGIHKENNESAGVLKKELALLRELNQHISKDAQNLTDALKGDKKKLGNWGEVQLERNLQLAGLVKGDHYEAQMHCKDTAGKAHYPDFVIKLPDDKHIVIDSKASLVAYEAAVSAESDDEQGQSLQLHVQALRDHIKGLSEKNYSHLNGLESPSFVFMFLPIEAAYIEALRFCPELYDEAFQRNVVLVSHTTLMPLLKTVSNVWMLERSHSEVKELSERAGEIFNQVCALAERLQKLGGTLITANKHYNHVLVSLTGQQGLYGKVERFSALSVEANKKMPKIEPVNSDVELERLAFVTDSDQEKLR
jgi:DNA recombination protein RmuC